MPPETLPEKSPPGMIDDIAKLLRDEGKLSEEKIQDVVKMRGKTGNTIDKILMAKGYLTEPEILKIFSVFFALEYRGDLRDVNVPKEFLDAVPVQFARNYNLIGLGSADGSMLVASCEPFQIHPMDELASMLGVPAEPVFAPRAEITSLINRAYKHRMDVVEDAMEDLEDDEIVNLSVEAVGEGEDLLDVANKAPIIKLVNMILFQALKMRASDVHIQPYADRLQVRYRVDGILYDMESAPKKIQDAVISRIKVMGKMDIAERRLPQDGRATLRIGQGDVDVRISSIPSSNGERIVMRLLDKSARVYRLEEIGLEPANLELLRHYISYTHGIIFVTGPTGSGKTTTLYAGLSELNAAEKNILTIEDPIEYNLDGISQVQVNNKKGLTFAAGLRSFLRQDPDVMMVGEVRDGETAEIAIRAALTGHMVLSTLHTNDASSAVTRMLDIGVEPYLVSSSVILVIAQRLVRLICPKCKEQTAPDKVTVKKLKEAGIAPDAFKDGKVWVGRGCDYCLGSGYVDRTAIYEMLPIDDAVREQVMDRLGASTIKKSAIDRGALKTLRMDGIHKVLRGQTTIDEVLRVTQLDVM